MIILEITYKLLTVPVVIRDDFGLHTSIALIADGAAGNFIDAAFSFRLNLALQTLDPPLYICVLVRTPMGLNFITLSMKLTWLHTGLFPQEQIQLCYKIPQSSSWASLALSACAPPPDVMEDGAKSQWNPTC